MSHLSHLVNPRVESFVSPRGLGTTWFIVDDHGPYQSFSTKEEAERVLAGGKRDMAVPLCEFVN